MSENETAARPAPQDAVVDHPAWREALAQVRAALSRSGAVVAILGPAGTGKTLMLRALRREAQAEGRDVVLLERGDAEVHPAVRPDIVMVDEADRIDSAMLQVLAESGARGIVLAALPGFAERLASVPGAVVVPLRRLEPAEAAAFLRARAEVTSALGWLGHDAAAEIVASCRGIPRLLGAVLTAAEFVAKLDDAPCVTVEHVREAVSLRGDFNLDADEAVPEEAVPEGAAPEKAAELPPAPQPDPSLLLSVPEEAPNVGHLDPEERRAESVDAVPASSEPARRRARLLVFAAGVAVAALTVLLVVAYATVQPAGIKLGQWASALLPTHAIFSAPARNGQLSAPATPVAVAVPEREASATASNAEAGAAEPPRGVVPHVVLSFQQGDADAERRSIEAVRVLRVAGFAASDPVPVVHRISNLGITYFFAEDQAGAAEVGRVLGGLFGKGRIVALRPGEPLPRPGTIEIQVSSDQSAATK